MEIWGRCDACALWFYCPLDDSARDGWSCPSCAGEPIAIENRAAMAATLDLDPSEVAPA